MASLDQFVIYFNDEFGRVLPNAKLFSYEAGTTTQKDTYTDVDLANENEWPVISDGAGRFPPVFLASGGYRFVVQDENGVQQFDRDNLNVSENLVLTSSDFVFSTLIDAKQGILINGESINLQVGQAVTTLGNNTSTDGEGAEWEVVPGGTGTADDDLFADLSNGNQIQRLFNQLYVKNNLSEIADAGAAAQDDARANIKAQEEPDAVAGFIPTTSYYIIENGTGTTGFDVDANIGGSMESVGPSGSGATNIWTALDAIPLDATFVTIVGFYSWAGVTSGSGRVQSSFRSTGGAFPSVPQISTSFGISSGNASSMGNSVTTNVPLDSANTFEMDFQSVGTSIIPIALLYVAGFGI